MKLVPISLAMTCLLTCGAGADSESESAKYWPQWRGPHHTGVAPNADPPQEWSETKNIRWKVEIPGSGLATPIIWGDRVYVQSAIKLDKKAAGSEAPAEQPAGGRSRRGRRASKPSHFYEFVIMALERKTGKIIWQTKASEAVPHEGHHPDASFASASPVTDGEHLLAFFGSQGLYCLDMNGKVQWQSDLGQMTTRRSFGEGSSPVLHGDTVVINWDHEGDSFIAAFDKNTGKPRWKKARDEVTSWSTPIVVEHAGRPQVIVNATKRVRGYDLASGDVLWECAGQTTNTIPSPVFGHGMVYAMSGFRGNMLQAIRIQDARGDVTGSSSVAWSYDQDTPYVPSPLLYGDLLYFLKHNRAILSCLDAAKGTGHFTRQRLEGIDGVYASPVGAAGRVYIAGRNGATIVLRKSPQFEVLAVNSLDERFDASPAIVDGELYLRGRKHLYCIARP